MQIFVPLLWIWELTKKNIEKEKWNHAKALELWRCSFYLSLPLKQAKGSGQHEMERQASAVQIHHLNLWKSPFHPLEEVKHAGKLQAVQRKSVKQTLFCLFVCGMMIWLLHKKVISSSSPLTNCRLLCDWNGKPPAHQHFFPLLRAVRYWATDTFTGTETWSGRHVPRLTSNWRQLTAWPTVSATCLPRASERGCSRLLISISVCQVKPSL